MIWIFYGFLVMGMYNDNDTVIITTVIMTMMVDHDRNNDKTMICIDTVHIHTEYIIRAIYLYTF